MIDLDSEAPGGAPPTADAPPVRGSEPVLSSRPEARRPSMISDELSRIRSAVQALSPADAAIGFEYDGRLRINIDVRSLEDLARLETLLPRACEGLFHNIQRRLVEHRPFFHRLSAVVDR